MSSKRNIRKHTCSRKKRYNTYDEAYAAMTSQSFDTHDTHLTPYGPCSFCGGGWHVGHAHRGTSAPNAAKYMARQVAA
jgi:hypothetical protein